MKEKIIKEKKKKKGHVVQSMLSNSEDSVLVAMYKWILPNSFL